MVSAVFYRLILNPLKGNVIDMLPSGLHKMLKIIEIIVFHDNFFLALLFSPFFSAS